VLSPSSSSPVPVSNIAIRNLKNKTKFPTTVAEPQSTPIMLHLDQIVINNSPSDSSQQFTRKERNSKHKKIQKVRTHPDGVIIVPSNLR